MAILINGNLISAQVNEETRQEVAIITSKGLPPPCLAVILVGDNPASQVYVSKKMKKCEELGIISKQVLLPQSTSEEELLHIIEQLNHDDSIHGILVQSPVPKHIDEQKIIMRISPQKDVDCFHPMNTGLMLNGKFDGFLPCTPWGIITLLRKSSIQTSGKHAVILGRSNIVGKPMAVMLSSNMDFGNATVTVCHSKTPNLSNITRSADIIVVAMGKPEFLTGEMVSDGVVVIDVGINRIPDSSKKTGFRLVGDVEFDSVEKKASYITPVPGGVGPMTIAMLMKNTIRAYYMRAK